MAKPATFGKRENEKKKQARRLEKQNRKEERKQSGKANSFDDMIAYVDEYGMITSTPPDPDREKEEIKQEEISISTAKQEEPDVLKGRVEHFNVEKGYGFIKDLAGTDKYFFHVNNVLTNIVENDIVTFDLEQGKRGLNAINICPLNQVAV
ncbi:cold-shock protein [Odoribacter sp. AF15-53]|uniref:cold-shock protein n=1 Tax=Odoribacter sp. AF15-53 TaxID=2292236 RepID=UPI000E47BFC6|nr:cold shock domain-containing protein [Odoribacter sp. AF15-53]RHR74822.1 cold shock domain-containing protein [Odoribacter sp. AF15-53]